MVDKAAAVSQEEGPAPREKGNVAILVSGQTLFMIASITVLTLSGIVGERLAPSEALATLPIALMMVGTVISTLPASLYMKRVGRRVGFMTGVSVGGIGGSLTAFAGIALQDFAVFCAGNMLLGFYQGFAMYYRFAANDVASPAFRSRAISYVMAGGVVAAFVGPWNARLDWFPLVPSGGPYLLIALLSLAALCLLCFLRVPAQGEPAADAPQRSMKAIIHQPAFPLAVLAGAVGYAVMMLVMTATPLAMLSMGFTMADVVFIMQSHVLGMFAPSFFTGSLIARFGVQRIISAGALMLVGSVLTGSLGQSLEFFWVALVLLGIGWNFLFIGGSALLTQLHTEAERGKVQGVNDLVIFSLVAVASLMAGGLLHGIGWEWLNLAMLPIIGIVAAAMWVAARG